MYAAHSEMRPRASVSVFVCEANLEIVIVSQLVSQFVVMLKLNDPNDLNDPLDPIDPNNPNDPN